MATIDPSHRALLRQEISHLTEQRMRALALRIDADLHYGAHRAVVAELRHLVATYPLRERSWTQLMLALYRSGRQAEALSAFAEARAILRTEPGS